MKKIIKTLKIIFISLISIVLITVMYFFISNRVFMGTENKDNIEYLSNNKSTIGQPFNEDLFDEDFYHSTVFLLGEIHGYAGNQVIDKDLFLFLNRKAGVRYYIAEMDSSTSDKLNLFLSKPIKDKAILKEVVFAIGKRIPQQSSEELFNKWDEIYDYNQQLPDSLRITVIGIDEDFDNNNPAIARDSAMMRNFKNSIEKLGIKNEKFYGFFGLFHTLQSRTETGVEPFAARLKKSGLTVTSFVSYTLDSEMYLPENDQFPTPPDEKIDWVNADGPLMLVKGINDLKALSQPNTITLFKLNSATAPYYQSQDLSHVKSTVFGENIVPIKESNTTDYFQYVFLLRNTKALTKLK